MLRDVAKNGRRSRFDRVWAQSKSYQMSGEFKWPINEMLLCNDSKPLVQTSINSDSCLLNHPSSCQFCISKARLYIGGVGKEVEAHCPSRIMFVHKKLERRKQRQ